MGFSSTTEENRIFTREKLRQFFKSADTSLAMFYAMNE